MQIDGQAASGFIAFLGANPTRRPLLTRHGGVPLNTTAGTPVNLMMTFPNKMTKQPQQSCKTIGILVPAEPGRSDGNLCLAHQWPACHRTSSPSPTKLVFSRFLNHYLVFSFRSANCIMEKLVSGVCMLPRSCSLTIEYAFPFPWTNHRDPSPMMANTHDRGAHFVIREKGNEVLPPLTAAHPPFR